METSLPERRFRSAAQSWYERSSVRLSGSGMRRFLRASHFAEMERVSIIERRVTPIERFTDRSSTSQQRLGAKAGDLISELE